MTLLLRAARRLGWAIVVVLGVATLSFVVAQVLPGDPARMMLGPQASSEDVAHARKLYGLDQPLPVQYARYWRRLVHRGPPARDDAHPTCAPLRAGVHVDLGYSFLYQRPVVDLLAARIPRSAELGLAAVLVQLVLGLSLGVAAAARRGTAWDDASTGVSLLGISAPTFLVGFLLQYLLAYKWRLLPLDGYGATPGEHLRSLVLPALTLGVFGSALYARLIRDELGGILAEDFVRTARAKGASPLRVLLVHALRNALVPVATVAAMELGTLVGGAVVTERLFRWPGVGQMAVEALLNRDAPVIFGTVLFTSTAVVAATLLVDLTVGVLDPRLRLPRAVATDGPPSVDPGQRLALGGQRRRCRRELRAALERGLPPVPCGLLGGAAELPRAGAAGRAGGELGGELHGLGCLVGLERAHDAGIERDRLFVGGSGAARACRRRASPRGWEGPRAASRWCAARRWWEARRWSGGAAVDRRDHGRRWRRGRRDRRPRDGRGVRSGAARTKDRRGHRIDAGRRACVDGCTSPARRSPPRRRPRRGTAGRGSSWAARRGPGRLAGLLGRLVDGGARAELSRIALVVLLGSATACSPLRRSAPRAASAAVAGGGGAGGGGAGGGGLGSSRLAGSSPRRGGWVAPRSDSDSSTAERRVARGSSFGGVGGGAGSLGGGDDAVGAGRPGAGGAGRVGGRRDPGGEASGGGPERRRKRGDGRGSAFVTGREPA